ncbi:hypothetical protein FACS1894211_01740 [Clostridia bacterium]|nr:hypothetical protein FACS1894211_01740 [Clostridia bacterium]
MDYIAFNTTDKYLQILLVRGGKAYTHCERAELTHSETLMPAVESLLKEAGCRLSDLQAVGVVTGPGSFTGIRIGIATVKGMLTAVPGLRALAVNSVLLKSHEDMRTCFQAEIAAKEFLTQGELKPVYLANPQAAGEFKLSVDRLTPDDAEQIAALEGRYFTNPETQEMILNRIRDSAARAVCIRDGGLACAYLIARAAADVCELETVAVRRAYRRLNFSEILLRDLADWAQSRLCAEIRLEVDEGNRAAIGLYEKFGFQKTAVRKGYYADGGNAALYRLEVTGRCELKDEN